MADGRPNILLVLQDQLRFDCVSDPALCATPAFDRMRAEGTFLRNHYTPLAICSPSRASLLTGLYPHANGVWNNMNGTDAVASRLPDDIPTVAELLRHGGYRTGYAGKWHVGQGGPAARGFDDVAAEDAWLGTDPRFAGYWSRLGVSPGVAGGDTDVRPPADHVRLTRYPQPGPRHAQRFHRIPFPLYSTEAVDEAESPAVATAEAGTDLLERYAGGDDPFFLVVSFIEPHWPNILPEPWLSLYSADDVEPWPNFDDPFTNKPRANQAGLRHFGVEEFTWDDWAPMIALYFGAVTFIDALCGRLLDAVDRLGLADDTLVAFTTDHGDMAGSHRQFNKGPLMYEETYHIPAAIRGPGVAGGTSTDALTSHVDVLPTLCEAAGVAAPEWQHGASLWPLLRGETGAPWRDALMCEFHGDEFGLYSQRMLRRGDHKLVYNPNDVTELYDLAADPAELHNLAGQPDCADLQRDLEANLLEVMHDTGDTLRLWAVNTLG